MKFLLLSLLFVCSASSFSIANEESAAKKDKRGTLIDWNNGKPFIVRPPNPDTCESNAKALSTKLYGLAMKIQDIQKAYATLRLPNTTSSSLPFDVTGWSIFINQKFYSTYDMPTLANWGACFTFSGSPGERTHWDYTNLNNFPPYLRTVICSEYDQWVNKNASQFTANLTSVYTDLFDRLDDMKAVIKKCNFVVFRNKPNDLPQLPGHRYNLMVPQVKDVAQNSWGILADFYMATYRAYVNFVGVSGQSTVPPSDCSYLLNRPIGSG